MRKRISYIRKKIARFSRTCLILGFISLAFLAAGLCLAVKSQGQVGLNVAAMGFCSLLLSIFGIGYGLLSFLDREKNYSLSKIGIGLEVILTVFWVFMFIIGVRG